MKTLTKQEAIANHRRMWNWIADETQRQQRKIEDDDYLKAFKINEPYFTGYCCEYDLQQGGTCKNCPINWGSEREKSMCFDLHESCDDKGIFSIWYHADWPEAAEIARKIANLPER